MSYSFLVWGTTSLTNINRLHVLQKKAIRHIAGEHYRAHTGPLFTRFCVVPAHNFYAYNLALRYKQCFKFSDGTLRTLAELKKKSHLYPFRNTEKWIIPYTLLNMSEQMLCYRLPKLLNYLIEHEIFIESTSKKTLRNFFVSVE